MTQDIIAAKDAEIKELLRQNKKQARQIKNLQVLQERMKSVQIAKSNLENVVNEEHQRQQKYMQLLLDNSPDIMILFDRQGRIAYCTSYFLKLVGIPYFDRINGHHYDEVFSQYISTDWKEQTDGDLQLAIEKKQSITVNAQFDIGISKKCRRYQIHYTPMLDDSHEAGGGIMLMHDITDLTDALDQAKKASTAKSDFLANMSHEMRTPMNAIIGMTNLAMETNELERKDYCLGKINDASNHLLGVINDILDMSKIESGKFELSSVRFNFENMLQKITNVIAFRVDEKEQHFTVQIDQAIPHFLEGDDQRLSQVITNLLSNAVKFTPDHGTIRLEAIQRKKEDDLYTIEIAVVDNGIGMTEEQQSRLFKSFEQAESGTSRKYGGTGLGLAISKNIVEMMGGDIWVHSKPDEGSCFVFTVQLRESEASIEKTLDPHLKFKDLKILVVDDIPEVLNYFVDIVKPTGILCDTASSGKQALELIEQSETGYDIYFIDWKMPEMDGIELAKHIRKNFGSNSIVIMISGARWSDIEDEAKSAGIDIFLPKPLFPSQIIDSIHQCLGSAESAELKELSRQSYDFSGKKLLLVEDVAINREIVIALLESTQLTIETAENGKTAVEQFSKAPESFDIIFMDIQMPEMDGYEATRNIRTLASPFAKSIPIVAMTANVFTEDVDKCLACGMNDHIGKPINPTETLKILNKYLKQSPAEST